jgi:hypothetical protein
VLQLGDAGDNWQIPTWFGVHAATATTMVWERTS